VTVDRLRVAVMGVFELVARHFAFDDSGIGARTADRQQFAQDFGGDTGFRVGDDLRGKNRGGLRSFCGLPEVIG
jgi:hypothetical protein